MQVQKEQIQRQQEILAALGYYKYTCDGIWGPKSIDAKKAFEADRAFVPGIPNNGLPFADRGPYPARIVMDHATGLLHHPKLDEKPAAASAENTEEDEAE